MKVLKILALVIFIGGLAVFIFLTSVFSGTTWGGWKPPNTSLKLNASGSIPGFIVFFICYKVWGSAEHRG